MGVIASAVKVEQVHSEDRLVDQNEHSFQAGPGGRGRVLTETKLAGR